MICLLSDSLDYSTRVSKLTSLGIPPQFRHAPCETGLQQLHAKRASLKRGGANEIWERGRWGGRGITTNIPLYRRSTGCFSRRHYNSIPYINLRGDGTPAEALCVYPPPGTSGGYYLSLPLPRPPFPIVKRLPPWMRPLSSTTRATGPRGQRLVALLWSTNGTVVLDSALPDLPAVVTDVGGGSFFEEGCGVEHRPPRGPRRPRVFDACQRVGRLGIGGSKFLSD